MAIARRAQTPGCAHGPGCPHDIGPAAAGIDGLSAMGRLSALRVPGIDAADVAQGYGPIEVRPATAEDLARLTPPAEAPAIRVGPAMHRLRPATGAASWRSYRSALGAPAPAPVNQLEEPAVTAPASPPAIACDTCLHVRVCKLRARLGPDLKPEWAEDFGDGLVGHWTFTLDCPEYHAAPETSGVLSQLLDENLPDPGPVRREHGGESWRTDKAPKEEPTSFGTVRVASIDELNAKVAAAPKVRPGTANASQLRGGARASKVTDERLVELMREHGGNTEAVRRILEMAGPSIRQRLERMRKRGTLPGDVAELLSARKAMYQPKAATA